MLNNQSKKKKTNTILLIVICCLGIANLFKIFTLDNHLKEAKTALKEAKNKISEAQLLTTKAQKELKTATNKLLKFEVHNQKLQLEIDSIFLVKKAKTPKDWAERQSIIKKQKQISSALLLLREKGKEFE